MDMTALDQAVAAAGSPAALARALGIKQPSICGWYRRKQVPVDRCAAIESATGVPRHALRPDIFQAPSDADGCGAADAEPLQSHDSDKAAALAPD